MKQEVLGTVQGVAGGWAEEWKVAEPAGEDQPDAAALNRGPTERLPRPGATETNGR